LIKSLSEKNDRPKFLFCLVADVAQFDHAVIVNQWRRAVAVSQQSTCVKPGGTHCKH